MRKLISIILISALLLVYMYIPSTAADGKTVLYLNYGDITIDENGISGYDINGEYVYEDNPLGYIITQKNPASALDRSITVSSVKCNIELKNVNIRKFFEYDCAFFADGTADVILTLSGENNLVSGTYRAGLEIGMNAKVTINGDGILYAQSNLQAGIGGGNGQSNGTLVIDSGIIYATGGINGYSAGIGGATSGHGGNITINGGYVCATGGLYGAGIGGGFMCGGGNITINGGVVTATGGNGGAGIGGGYLGSGTNNIIINGGSIKGIAGMYADEIGNGYKATSEFSGIHNSNGNTVTLKNIEVFDFKQIYIDGIDTYPVSALHSDDNKLYLYTDGTGKIVTEYMNDGSVNFIKVTNESVTQLYPYSGIRCDDKLITDGTISVADGFSVSENNDLMYDSVRIDTFTSVLRGDINLDDELNGMDAVIANCVVNDMLTDNFTVKISDADGNGAVNSDDVDLLIEYGLNIKNYVKK